MNHKNSSKSDMSYGSVETGITATSSNEDEGASLVENGELAQKEDNGIKNSTPPPKATIPVQVANMMNTIIGGGILSLPGGIAVYAQNGLFEDSLIAVLWVLAMGFMFGYFCLLIGRVCTVTGSTSYHEAWERTVVGRTGNHHLSALCVAVANTLDPLLGIFANASIAAQSLKLLLQGVLGIYWTETQSLLLVTVVFILPLCLLKNLKALAPFSTVGVLAVLGAFLAMLVRYLDGSYRPGGTYYEDLEAAVRPQLDYDSDNDNDDSDNSLGKSWQAYMPFVAMVYTSFDMHYNSPRFYAELKDATIPRYGKMMAYSFTMVSCLYLAIAVVGFLTFGAACDSFILNNYSPQDPLAVLSRLGVGLSTLLTYPMNFIGVRDNFLDIFGIADRVNTDAKRNLFTVSLLALITTASCFITDLGQINAFGGGTTVTSVCFVFPAIMFLSYHQQELNKTGWKAWGKVLEMILVAVLMMIGVVIGVVGAWYSLTHPKRL